MLGFDAVHWVGREPGMEREVDRINALSGGYDTFTYVPDIWADLANAGSV